MKILSEYFIGKIRYREIFSTNDTIHCIAEWYEGEIRHGKVEWIKQLFKDGWRFVK